MDNTGFQSERDSQILPSQKMSNKKNLLLEQSKINPEAAKKHEEGDAAGGAGRVEFPACYRMDHLCQERLWVRSHIQILQLKPYCHSGHLDFLICNETKEGMASPPQNTSCFKATSGRILSSEEQTMCWKWDFF